MYTNAYSHRAWYQVLSDPSNWDDEVWYMRPDKEECPIANDVGEGFFKNKEGLDMDAPIVHRTFLHLDMTA
jgi:hypothetical protein